MEADLPWVIGAVRQILVADADFMMACQNRVLEKSPSTVSVPYATIQLPTAISDLGGGVYRCMVQVDGWSPAEGYQNTEASVLVWRIVTRANRALRVSNRTYQTMRFSSRPTDIIPLPDDKSRGDANPLVHAATRAVLTIHNE